MADWDSASYTKVLNVGGNLLQGYFNRRAMRKQFEREKEWWKQRFDTTNAYNSPVQQMVRLKEAGLNPALMYGGSQGGNTAESPSSDGPGLEQYTGLGQIGMGLEQIKNLVADTRLKNAQTATEGFEATIKEADGEVARNLANASAEATQLDLRMKRYNTEMRFIETQFKERKEQLDVLNAMSDLRTKAESIKKMQSEIELNLSKKGLTDQQIKTEVQKTLETKYKAVYQEMISNLAKDGIYLNQSQYSMMKELVSNVFGSGGSQVLVDKPDSQLTKRQQTRKRNQKRTINFGRMSDFGPKL